MNALQEKINSSLTDIYPVPDIVARLLPKKYDAVLPVLHGEKEKHVDGFGLIWQMLVIDAIANAYMMESLLENTSDVVGEIEDEMDEDDFKVVYSHANAAMQKVFPLSFFEGLQVH